MGAKKIEGTYGALRLVMGCLGLGFAGAAVSIIVSSKPEVMDSDPKGAEEFREPLALRVGHVTMVADAVLRL